MKRIILILLVLVANVVGANANFCVMPNNDWALYAGIGLMLTIAISTILYFIGGFINNVKVKAWSKVQIYNALGAVIMMAIIFMVMLSACNNDATSIFMFTFKPQTTNQNFYEASNQYFEKAEMASYKLMKMARYDIGVGNVRASISAFGSQYGIIGFLGGPSKSWAPFTDEYSKVSLFNLVLRTSTIALLNTLFLKTVFEYIGTGVLTLLLPAGLVLSSISITKPIGSALVALSIGLFVLYPATFAMLDIYWGDVIEDYTVVDTPKLDTLPGAWIGEVNSWADVQHVMTSSTGIDWCKHPEYYYAEPNSGTCHDFFGRAYKCNTSECEGIDAGGIGVMGTGSNECSTKIYDFTFYGGILILSTIFMPYLGIIIIAAMVREISKVMGQEIDMAKVARMI